MAISPIKASEFLMRIYKNCKVISHDNGRFPSLVSNGEMWLIISQRASIPSCGVFLCHGYSSSVVVKELHKDEGIAILTNNQGSVEVTYGGSSDYIYSCAIRLY